MNKKEDIYNDEFIKELLKDTKLEEPPDRFTNQVMDHVMQDWLAKPIEMRKPISKKQWIWLSILIVLLTLILLGTDVHQLVSNWEHPFFSQLNTLFLHPIHQILTKVFSSLVQLPVIVYVVLVAVLSLFAFDRIITKMMSYR